MDERARVLSIIVNYNGGHWVVAAANSLLQQDCPTDVIVLDNDSSDDSVAALRSAFPQLTVIETGENLGSVRGYNWALRYPDYDYYVFFNPDALAEPSMVGDLVRIMSAHPKLAVLGPTIVEYDTPEIVQAFDPRNDFLLFPYDRWEGRTVAELPDVDVFDAGFACAAAVMCRASVFRELKGMEELFFMFVEEPDFCWRARLLDYEIGVTPRVRVRHYGGVAAAVGNKGGGHYITSLRRIYLRERNGLMMGIKCYALPSLLLYSALLGLSLMIEGTILMLLGRGAITKSYFEAVRDALKCLPALLRKRATIQRTRRIAEAGILSKAAPGYAKFTVLLKRGIPLIKEWQRSSQ